MLVASWSRIFAIVAYSSVVHRTKSSAYIAHFTGDGNFLMNSKKSVGDMTPPWDTPCLRSVVVVGPTPPPKNGGGVQQPFLRTPDDGILPPI